ncbi:heavy metal-associated domain-containing protein [Brevibacillus nitrificans]|uniref:heavy-metal-associated domain-containing protein n=1 Tax=Brevibacillus nitrificans TaxID=651560 RepID=UPI002859199A|nr:heavy metal-associated domain-containing protein [Brevibacillus nitrificans]MDR7316464.1 copper chaperone CopZ [Brevibacillus nitrificans]
MHTDKIPVQGMKDENDVVKVSEALHNVWGISQAEVSLSKGEARVSYDEKAASLLDFQQAIRDLGYGVPPSIVPTRNQ